LLHIAPNVFLFAFQFPSSHSFSFLSIPTVQSVFPQSYQPSPVVPHSDLWQSSKILCCSSNRPPAVVDNPVLTPTFFFISFAGAIASYRFQLQYFGNCLQVFVSAILVCFLNFLVHSIRSGRGIWFGSCSPNRPLAVVVNPVLTPILFFCFLFLLQVLLPPTNFSYNTLAIVCRFLSAQFWFDS